MDRTAWIVVSLCTAALVAWFVAQPKPQPRPPQPPQIVQAATTASQNAPADAAAPQNNAAPQAPATLETPEQTWELDNGGIRTVFSSKGGGLKTSTLPPHHFSGDTPTVLNGDGIAAIGALCRQPGDVESGSYELKSLAGQVPVIFERTLPDGVTVRKTWTPVTEGAGKGFLWKLSVAFKNSGAAEHRSQWSLYAGTAVPLQKSEQHFVAACWNADGEADQANSGQFDQSGFLGMTFRQATSTVSHDFKQLLWGGVHSQYYTTLIAHTMAEKDLPAGGLWSQRKPYHLKQGDDTHALWAQYAGLGLPEVVLGPGQEKIFEMEVYQGPRAQTVLSKLGRRFDAALFYGMFGFISKPMLWALTKFEQLFSFTKSSWGWAIILLTIAVRGILWPLNIKATRQMKRMSLLAPQMKELQAKYKDDPQKMNAQVMGLYKKFGVNPVSGCLPMLLQIPIFFGLYQMLQVAVELRGHGFMWVNDLALPDTQFYLWGFPFNPLPLVMAGTMFIQMALTPKSPDPNMQMQQRIFLLMPLFFLVFCYNFAAALALYWTISNIIGIIQSWVVKRMPEPELVERSATTVLPPDGGGSKKKGGKPSFMEIFAERLAEQQKKAASRTLPGAHPGGKNPRTGGSAGSALKKSGDQ